MKVFDNNITKEMVKGFSHAVVMPILAFVISASIGSDLTGFAPIGYFTFASLMYYKIQKRHIDDVSHPIHEASHWFLTFGAGWLIFILFLGFVILGGVA